jgi:lauroyl/myristoyl acyltransferase
MSREESSTASSTSKYFSAVAALDCVAPLDPALRGRLLLARGLARMLLPANAGRLRYAFEELLGETAASARRLLYDWFFYRHLESRSWTHVGANGGRGSFADAEDVGAYLAACPRGIVVATIHLGDYLEGLRQLRVVAAAGKRVFVVRRSQWSEREHHAFARIAAGLALTVLRTGHRAALVAIRELRRGGIVVVLYDLPQRFGRAVSVELFDERANVVCGPAELAVLGGADILPIFTHFDASGASCVEALPVLPVRSVQRESADARHARVVAITQRLWSLAEQQIRRFPAQWAHWLWIHELVMRSPRHHGDVSLISRE